MKQLKTEISSVRMTAKEIRGLSSEARSIFLEKKALEAQKLYEENSDLINDIMDEPVSYAPNQTTRNLASQL